MDAETNIWTTCSNPQCRVAETGRCVEGLEFAKCPRYGREPEIALDDDEGLEFRHGTALPGAEALETSSVDDVLGIAPARVVAIVGPNNAGKTSLLAGMYEQFQAGPVGGIAFSRSRTLHGFELICHDARAESSRQQPHTERTRRGEVRFYHLELAGTETLARVELVIADRAGEEYREILSDVAAAPILPEIARADTITLLVDGDQLVNAGLRHNVRNTALMTVQALKDSGASNKFQNLAVVLTKLDQVLAEEKNGGTRKFFQSLVDELRKRHVDDFAAIEDFQVAASPKTTAAAPAAGLQTLLEFWLKEPGRHRDPKPEPINNSRLFGRLRAE